MLENRGLLDPSRRTHLSKQLVEVIALLDMYTFTINRIAPSLNLWMQYVSVHYPTGIEEISGLPYSLLSILSNVKLDDTEEKLMSWLGERSDVFAQQHMWEAVRLAGILHSRELQQLNNAAQNSGQSTQISKEVLIAKLFASIQALTVCAHSSDRPFAHTLLYPLFLGALSTKRDTYERDFAEKAFDDLIKTRTSLTGRVDQPASVAFHVVLEAWERSKTQTEATAFSLALEFTAELGIELHLY